jgi:hypothetical protein
MSIADSLRMEQAERLKVLDASARLELAFALGGKSVATPARSVTLAGLSRSTPSSAVAKWFECLRQERVGFSPAQVGAYWIDRRIRGQGMPPRLRRK